MYESSFRLNAFGEEFVEGLWKSFCVFLIGAILSVLEENERYFYLGKG